MKTIALIAAAGQGKRMKNKPGKQFLNLAGKPLLYWTLKRFQKARRINEICLVVSAKDLKKARVLIKKYGFHKVKYLVIGGRERKDSVYNGLKAIKGKAVIVVIHDGARPLLSERVVDLSIASAKKHGSGIAAVALKDTIKKITNRMVEETPLRDKYYLIQTPQAFQYDLAMRAYQSAKNKDIPATDDASLVEKIKPVHIIEGSYENIKVTTPEDLLFANALIRSRKSKCLI